MPINNIHVVVNQIIIPMDQNTVKNTRLVNVNKRTNRRQYLRNMSPPKIDASDAVFSAHPVPLSVIEPANRNANNAIWDWPMMCTKTSAVVNSVPRWRDWGGRVYIANNEYKI